MKHFLIRLAPFLGLLALAPDVQALQATSGAPVNHFHLDEPHSPDIAASPAGYLAIWRDRKFESAQLDYLYGQHLKSDGTADSARFIIEADEVNDPSVAYFLSSNVGLLYVVAYERAGNIYLRTIAPGSTEPSAEVEVAATQLDEVKPDVGFGLGVSRIVFEVTGSGIRGVTFWVDWLGNLEFLSTYEISSGANDHAPAIVQHRGGGPRTMVTWRRQFTPTHGDIYARSFWGWDPTPSDPVFQVVHTFNSAQEPDVSAARPDEFMITWSEIEAGAPDDRDVYARRVAYFAGPGNGETLGEVISVSTTAGLDEADPCIQFTGNSYLVTTMRTNPGAGTPYSIESSAVDSLSGAVLGNTVTAGAQVARGHALSAWTPESLGTDMALSYVAKKSWLTAQEIENRGGRVTINSASGCDVLGGDTIVSTATGGNPEFRMELRYGEPGAWTYLLLSALESPIPFGSATLIPAYSPGLTFFNGFTTAEGTSVLEFSLPASVSGFSIWGQWLTLSVSAPCTGWWFTLSDAVRMDLD